MNGSKFSGPQGRGRVCDGSIAAERSDIEQTFLEGQGQPRPTEKAGINPSIKTRRNFYQTFTYSNFGQCKAERKSYFWSCFFSAPRTK